MFDILCYDNNFAGINIASVSSNSYISDVTDFDIIKMTSICTQSKFATMEHNKWRLDGSYRILEDIRTSTSEPRNIVSKLAYWSGYMSNDNCTFTTAPYIEIKFASDMDTYIVSGITITAGDRDDYCTAATITLYNGTNVVKTYDTTSDTYILSQAFDDVTFNAVRVAFTKTNKPNRFIRLSAVKLKKVTHLSEDKFYDVRLLEEMSIISDTLPIGTLSFTVSATKQEIRKLSNYKYMELYKDGVQFGGYYLDDIKKVTNDKYTVYLNDAVKVLDNTSFPDALYMSVADAPISVSDVIKDILSDTNIPCAIEADYSNTNISIGFHNDTKRTALAKLLYVTNSTCKKKRSGALWIGSLDVNSNIKSIDNKIFDDYTITENAPISQLSMQHNILSGGTETKLSRAPIKVVQKDKDGITFRIDMPTQLYSATITSSLIGGSLWSRYADGDKVEVRFVKYGLDNIPTITMGNKYITLRIDRNVLKNDGRSIHWYVRAYHSFRWLNRYSGIWYDRPDIIQNADFSTFEIIDGDVDITYEDLTIKTADDVDAVINTDIQYALKTRDLQVQTVTLASLNMNDTIEYGSQQITEETEQEDGSVVTQTRTENINLILPKLMDRYYKYNREFEGTILAEGLECGDTVSMNLRDVGYTTGTITQLEYNLTNKEIARVKIWLYESEGEAET